MYPWLFLWAPQLQLPFSGDVAQRIEPRTQWFFDGIDSTSGDPVIEADDLPLPVALEAGFAAAAPLNTDPLPTSLPDAERRLLLSALERNRWNVTQAARALGISRDTMRYRIDKFDLREGGPAA